MRFILACGQIVKSFPGIPVYGRPSKGSEYGC
jgi:hypothetical protein